MLALVLLLLVQPLAEEEAVLHRRVAAQPQAIRTFIERRAMCNHFGGEEPYDANRRREIEEAIKDLDCQTLRGEEMFLRRHFANHPDTIPLLDDTSDRIGW